VLFRSITTAIFQKIAVRWGGDPVKKQSTATKQPGPRQGSIKAVGYVRVSTVDQAVDGVSLDAQRSKVEAWAELNGARLIAVHEDAGISGSTSDNRPGLQAAIDDACRHRAALVVYSLSRMSRSTKDTLSIAEQLERAGADLVSLSENIDTISAAGKMVFRILAVLAEFERDLISERTRAALSHLREKGRKTGGDIPYGFDSVSGRLVPNKKESRVVDLIMQLHRQEMSLRDICRELHRKRYRTKNGQSKWSVNVVAAVIRRSF